MFRDKIFSLFQTVFIFFFFFYPVFSLIISLVFFTYTIHGKNIELTYLKDVYWGFLFGRK